MNIETIRELLAWCAVINFGILTIWFLGFTLARDKIYRLHMVNGLNYQKIALIPFIIQRWLFIN